jgi:hypothetical protein
MSYLSIYLYCSTLDEQHISQWEKDTYLNGKYSTTLYSHGIAINPKMAWISIDFFKVIFDDFLDFRFFPKVSLDI